jgi:Mn-dependent DtxR family transcriptional regulator
MYHLRTRPAPIDYDYVIYLAFTHPDNKHASIRKIARLLGMNPGTVYRTLKRQGFVTPDSRSANSPIPKKPMSTTNNGK